MLDPNTLHHGPSSRLEFIPEPTAEALAEALVAFANTDGGTIVVGLDASGDYVGQVYSEDLENILKQAESRLRPPVVIGNWEQVETEQGAVVAIRVPRSIELHALEDGRVLVRSGAENRPLGGDEIRRLASTKSTGDFEAETVPGASFSDFDRDILDEYLAKREERLRRVFTGDEKDLLKEIGALNQDGDPTVAGILLFSKYPQQWLPQSGVVFVKFVGTEPRGEDGMAGYARREEITGPLARLVENLWELTWSEMAVSAVVRGLEREETYEYPTFAVREALVNAVCHRDFRLRGRRIEVRMYRDHIEELGLGIDRMIEEMVQSGHRPPDFTAKPYSFTVTLYNARERLPVFADGQMLNNRQIRAMQYVREHGSITNREYRTLCPDVSPETIRLDLSDLVERGQLLKIGSKKGTYYILKSPSVG